MMLYNIDGIAIERIPHRNDYETWKSRLSEAELKAVKEELNRVIDIKLESNERIVTSSCVGGGK